MVLQDAAKVDSYIILKDLRIFAYHGVMPQENLTGDYFLVNLRLKVDISPALSSDRLEDTINYGKVYEIVKSEMAIPSKLIEHVAGRICKSIFRKFQSVTEIDIEILKQNPPMGADCGGAGIKLTLTNNQL